MYRFKDNAFERLDTSFEHRNKYRSYDFTFENKIYSYGGYGLFNVNSNLTFFNELNREWSEFLYNPNSKTPSPRQLTIGQVKDSFLYIAGGSNKQVNEQLELNYNVLEDVWKLDLKTHFWTYLGTLNLDFFNSSNEVFSPATLSGSYKGGTLVIFKGKAIWFDIKNNRIKEFTNVNPILLENIEFIDFNPDTNLFMFSKLIHDSQAYRFIFMTPSELLGNSVNEHPLYNSDIQYVLYLLSILLLVGIILVVYFKTKTKSSYSVILIHLNKIQKELSSEDFSVMKLILNEYPTAVDFPLILTFFEPNLSYESRVKKLRLSIGRIDKVLMVHTKSKVSILKFRKNKNDRRIKEVFLN